MELHSQILGKGRPFIILHGFLGMGDNWKSLGNRWAEEGYEVHLLDQRNHGRSFHSEAFSYKVLAQDVLEYCQARGLEDIVLLGHSMGGKVAMEFAVAHPDRVSKLIVADIGPKAYPPHHQDILKALSELDFSQIASRGQAEEVLSQYIADEGTRLFLLKNLYRKKKDQFALRINLPVLSDNIGEIGKALPEGSVFNGETLFLAGEKSDYIEETDSVLIKKHFPRAEISTIPNAGHWLHAENPEVFFERCEEFLKN